MKAVKLLVIIALVTIMGCTLPEDPPYIGIGYEEVIPVTPPTSTLSPDWWKATVFYECYVRGFMDSDADGIGDLQGLITKLDYLQDLGITGIWLMPVTESSDDDHGYAVSNYWDIETDYGTLTDFDALLSAAHSRGIGVVMDLVINHSSYQHPFFLDSQSSKTSDHRDWYCWATKDLGWTAPWGGGSAWHSDPTGYYYAIFYYQQPDLNFKKDAVGNYMADTIRFWLNRGLDGFRFDAIPYLVENNGIVYHQPESTAYYARVRGIMDQYDNVFSVGEDTLDPDFYLTQGVDTFHSTFLFNYNYCIMGAVKNNNPQYTFGGHNLDWFITQEMALPAANLYSIILANHDHFTGARPFTQFIDESNEETALLKCKLAASYLLLTPGIPFIYYGEEIAISSNATYGTGDWSIRTPMQWDATANAGFSSATPFRNVNANYATYNVAVEDADSASVLNHYKKLIAIRNANPELQQYSFEKIATNAPTTFFSFIRTDGTNQVVVVLNFSDTEASCTLDFTGTALEGVSKTAGFDLYDGVTTYPNLTPSNDDAYDAGTVPAYGVRLIPLS